MGDARPGPHAAEVLSGGAVLIQLANPATSFFKSSSVAVLAKEQFSLTPYEWWEHVKAQVSSQEMGLSVTDRA